MAPLCVANYTHVVKFLQVGGLGSMAASNRPVTAASVGGTQP